MPSTDHSVREKILLKHAIFGIGWYCSFRPKWKWKLVVFKDQRLQSISCTLEPEASTLHLNPAKDWLFGKSISLFVYYQHDPPICLCLDLLLNTQVWKQVCMSSWSCSFGGSRGAAHQDTEVEDCGQIGQRAQCMTSTHRVEQSKHKQFNGGKHTSIRT